jgi:acyl transferase domain-containing protein
VVNTSLREWPESKTGVRRGGVSAFGFGGTNFHIVVEEHIPGRRKPKPKVFAAADVPSTPVVTASVPASCGIGTAQGTVAWRPGPRGR